MQWMELVNKVLTYWYSVAWSGLVCASRVVGIDRLSVGSYVRFQRG